MSLSHYSKAGREPKTRITYHVVLTVVTKNCDPFVLGPAFAIDRSPAEREGKTMSTTLLTRSEKIREARWQSGEKDRILNVIRKDMKEKQVKLEEAWRLKT